MTSLWSVSGDQVHLGYANIRGAQGRTNKELNEHLDSMWSKFEPFADAGFVYQFAQDPDAHFWEMYLGYSLLEAGKKLLTAGERQGAGGLPDICITEGDRRIWIEAIAPERGEPGPNQVVGPKPINEGGGFEPAPIRQSQLRVTSALWDKSQVVKAYLESGTIKEADVRLIAISAGRFGLYVSDDPPLIISSVFPIGDEFVTVDPTGENVVNHGFKESLQIEKHGVEPIPRTAFLDDTFKHVSGIIYTRAGIGMWNRRVRPLTLVHNPMAEKPMDRGWPVWDKEYVTEKSVDAWTATDIAGE